MAKQLFQHTLDPYSDWILVRIPEQETNGREVLLAEGGTVRAASSKKNVGIVVAVGPGDRATATGELIPLDPRLVPGATVLFAGKTLQRPEDFGVEMAAEGLYFLPAGAIISFVRAPSAKLARVT